MNTPQCSLADWEVLAIDCQTTGATPRAGALVEVGWAAVKPSSDRVVSPATCLIRLPEGHDLPLAVQKLTGIRPEDLDGALAPADAWQRLAAAAQGVGGQTGKPCGAVIHYARFERGFLEPWHVANAPGTPFPLDIICTHKLARRLLPGLPRCGLRALAGYFGMRLPAVKRCAPHVMATALIWQRIVALLAEEEIDDRATLTQWLQSDAKPTRHPRTYPMPLSRRNGIPDRPGIYRFRRSSGDLLYVGKAKSLKRRIGSYFQSRRRHPEHILEMLTQAVRIDFTTTATALEAALAEADDIQRMAPEYNLQLQAAEQPPVFCSRDFQQVGECRNADLPLGPWPSSRALRPLAALVRFLAPDDSAHPLTKKGLHQALGLPRESLPPLTVFGEGLTIFQKQNGLIGTRKDMARRLLLRGADFWRMTREIVPDDMTVVSGEDESGHVWTPQAVVHYLESVARLGGFHLRRGRWFMLLCEATLAWELQDQKQTAASLEVRGGRVIVLPPAPMPAVMPPPVNHHRPLQKRRTCFDAPTYTRLRVLTTEMRRLVSQNRTVRICLRPGVVLDQKALTRLMFWI